MYDELVKRLRSEAVYLPEKFSKNAELLDVLMKAADAIEELSKKYLASEVDNTNLTGWLAEEHAKHLWIPVTERLPEEGIFVLVCNDDVHMMIAKYETETYEWYYKYTNYDFDIWDNEEQGPVCYWMPLPEPPEEG